MGRTPLPQIVRCARLAHRFLQAKQRRKCTQRSTMVFIVEPQGVCVLPIVFFTNLIEKKGTQRLTMIFTVDRCLTESSLIKSSAIFFSTELSLSNVEIKK